MGTPVRDDLRISQLDPADRSNLEALFARHRFRPSHRLGQNFLVDPGLRDRVAEELAADAEDEILEVGAGPGTLTVALAQRARRVIAVEIDRRLLAMLREVVGGDRRVEVVEGDVLKLPLPAVPLVAGNIPYYLTGALLPRLLDRPDRPRRVGLVVQKEVAERWTTPGDWSLATLAVQVFAVPELRFELPRGAFWPEPAVDSALVTMETRPRPAVDVASLAGFFRFAERVFQFRRKQLGGILARLGAPEAAVEAGIDPSRRPQTLSLAEWEALYRAAESRLS
jgi:16S rRNA (adenine1518-N6/adenine1519-N6)-dimethyltransferase